MKPQRNLMFAAAFWAVAGTAGQAGEVWMTIDGHGRDVSAAHLSHGRLTVRAIGDGGALGIRTTRGTADTDVRALGTGAGGEVINRSRHGRALVVLGMCPRGTSHAPTVTHGTGIHVPVCR